MKDVKPCYMLADEVDANRVIVFWRANIGAARMLKMKKFFVVAFLGMFMSTAYAGNCGSPNDRASDGSRCGERSADSRPGG